MAGKIILTIAGGLAAIVMAACSGVSTNPDSNNIILPDPIQVPKVESRDSTLWLPSSEQFYNPQCSGVSQERWAIEPYCIVPKDIEEITTSGLPINANVPKDIKEIVTTSGEPVTANLPANLPSGFQWAYDVQLVTNELNVWNSPVLFTRFYSQLVVNGPTDTNGNSYVYLPNSSGQVAPGWKDLPMGQGKFALEAVLWNNGQGVLPPHTLQIKLKDGNSVTFKIPGSIGNGPHYFVLGGDGRAYRAVPSEKLFSLRSPVSLHKVLQN